jgi:hypothetical protein
MKCMARHGHGEDANISLVILEGLMVVQEVRH